MVCWVCAKGVGGGGLAVALFLTRLAGGFVWWQGFFGPRVPVDNLDAGTIGVNYFLKKQLVNPMVISPDAGGVYRAKKFLEE